jgi:hypothetical protein
LFRTEHRIEENKKIGLSIVIDEVLAYLGIAFFILNAGIDTVPQRSFLIFLPLLDIVLYIIFAIYTGILVHPFHLIVLVQKRAGKVRLAERTTSYYSISVLYF